MIIAALADNERLRGRSAAFQKAFKFLSRRDLASLSDGIYEIEGRNVYAVMAHCQGKGRSKAKLEAHRKYIDIQYVISGSELIGIKNTVACVDKAVDYDLSKDIIFFSDKADKYIELNPGELVILFPEDAHAPLAGKTPLHKAVIKVCIQ
jgi:YhcH/YjgK/YiaL family protein